MEKWESITEVPRNRIIEAMDLIKPNRWFQIANCLVKRTEGWTFNIDQSKNLRMGFFDQNAKLLPGFPALQIFRKSNKTAFGGYLTDKNGVGYGKCVLQRGVYTGEFSHKVPSGRGELVARDGSKWVGDFGYGKFAEGVLICADGYTWQGEMGPWSSKRD
eukprot:TRINITY_DN9685_c0_g1_i1.p1 TRINITY_DN9685_c0_g1~~TRINITY_DN9685_c0_g1_i1.p1  ORF type:complete len:168 (-),score=32.83 TRINITY_DN9685_c0_g1_i1:198-677(-)